MTSKQKYLVTLPVEEKLGHQYQEITGWDLSLEPG